MLLNRRGFLSLLPAPMLVSAVGIMPVSAVAVGETTPLGPYYKAEFDILDEADNVIRTAKRIVGLNSEVRDDRLESPECSWPYLPPRPTLYLMPKEPIPDIVHEYATGRIRLKVETHWLGGPPMRKVEWHGSIKDGCARLNFSSMPWAARIEL